MSEFAFGFDGGCCEVCGGKCCVGESGYIFAKVEELERIATFLSMEFEEFLRQFVKKVGYKFSLLEKPFEDGFACVFFDTQRRKCRIYEVRPKQCQLFPFWEVYRDKAKLKSLFQECQGVFMKRKD